MASPKTRANMARVAAAAVFAAGASLAVVGTASAGEQSKDSSAPTAQDAAILGVAEGADGAILGLTEGNDGGADDGGADDGGADDGGADDGGADDGGADDGGADDGGADDGGADDGGADDGGADDGGADDGGADDGGAANGADGGSPEGVAEGAGGPQPDSEGATSPIEQNDPTEQLTEEEAEAVPSGNGELAETGASMNETLLIIGAATMIAGGVAFRYLPRLITKNGGAAAA